jgi:hypothetical protein
MIPLCWPTSDGQCGDGYGHTERTVGKAPLVAWEPFVASPPTEAHIATWRARWPSCNWAELLEPRDLLEVDCDSDEALAEATALGLPPAPVMKTAKGRRYRYRAPREVVGRRVTKRGRSRSIDLLAGGYVVVAGQHRTGPLYEWIVRPTDRPLVEAPAWAVRLLLETPVASAAPDVHLPSELPCIHLEGLRVSPRIRRLILDGTDPRYRSRSEAVFACAQALIGAGYNDATIAGILEDATNGISAKPRELGRRWLSREVARARAKNDVEVVFA